MIGTSKHGKEFEKIFELSVLKSGQDAMLLRLPDHDIAPADFMLLTENHNLLLELKSTRNERFELKAIKSHQLESLKLFQKMWGKNQGYIIIEYLLEKPFLLIINVRNLYEYVSRTGKKSIPYYITKDFMDHIKINRINGEYNLKPLFDVLNSEVLING